MKWLPTFWKVIYESGDGIKHLIVESEARPEVEEVQSSYYAIVVADSTIYLKSMYDFEPNIKRVDREVMWD